MVGIGQRANDVILPQGRPGGTPSWRLECTIFSCCFPEDGDQFNSTLITCCSGEVKEENGEGGQEKEEEIQ